MSWKDFVSMQNGFFNKRKYEQRVWRRAVTKLLQPYMEKNKTLSEYQIWPVDGDEELKAEERQQQVEVSEESLRRLRAFKEAEKNQKSKEN